MILKIPFKLRVKSGKLLRPPIELLGNALFAVGPSAGSQVCAE